MVNWLSIRVGWWFAILRFLRFTSRFKTCVQNKGEGEIGKSSLKRIFLWKNNRCRPPCPETRVNKKVHPAAPGVFVCSVGNSWTKSAGHRHMKSYWRSPTWKEEELSPWMLSQLGFFLTIHLHSFREEKSARKGHLLGAYQFCNPNHLGD